MLTRYQIGPFVAIGFFLVMLLTSVFGIYEAIWHHRWNGWLTLLTSLLMVYNFHKRYDRTAN